MPATSDTAYRVTIACVNGYPLTPEWSRTLEIPEVQDHQTVFDVIQEEYRAGEPRAVIRILEVEVQGLTRVPDRQGKRCLPNLPRTNQGHCGLTVQRLFDAMCRKPRYHPCK